MKKEEIIKEFENRVDCLSKIIDDIKTGKQDIYYKTQKEKDKAIYYQLGFIEAMRVAINYVNFLDDKNNDTPTTQLYSFGDFKVGDVAFDTAMAEIRDLPLFDEFGNLVKEIK